MHRATATPSHNTRSTGSRGRWSRHYRIGLALILWILASGLVSCTALVDQALDPSIGSPHVLLGKPSPATRFNANDYLIVRPQYVLSYNRDHGIPNWASWQLNQSWLGSLPRIPFQADPSLPQSWYQVQPNDYTGSGFDRGHLVPAADRNKTEADAQSVFWMTNILPQAPDNNQGAWEQLESHCRALVRQGKELYIIAGGAGIGGTGMRGPQATIARGKVVVPASTWKIVVVLDRPGAGLDSLTPTTPVIAVNVPNRQGIKTQNWTAFKTSVDQLEQLTGYNFLSAVPEPLQSALEAKVD